MRSASYSDGQMALRCKKSLLALFVSHPLKIASRCVSFLSHSMSIDKRKSKKKETSALLLMSIDNLMDLFSVCLSSQRRSVKTYNTVHPTMDTFSHFKSINRFLCVSSSNKAKSLVQKSGRIKRNKLLRIIQICYRKLHFKAVFLFGLRKKKKNGEEDEHDEINFVLCLLLHIHKI